MHEAVHWEVTCQGRNRMPGWVRDFLGYYKTSSRCSSFGAAAVIFDAGAVGRQDKLLALP